MPQPTQPAVEAAAARYVAAWETVAAAEAALLDAWPSLGRHDRIARLTALAVTVRRARATLDPLAAAFAGTDLIAVYAAGAASAGVDVVYTTADETALQAMAADAYTSLLDATAYMDASAKLLIRTLAREHVGDKLVSRDTAVQAARDLANSLADARITAVVYKDGSRHGLADYADMLLRTKTAEAYTTATLSQLDRAGVGFVECFDSSACGLSSHEDPEKPNGGVFPIAIAQTYPISHPNCVRGWGGRPDVTSAEAAKRAEPSTTAAQRADQARVAAGREAVVAARAARKRFESNVARTAAGILSDSSNRVRSVAHARALARRAAKARQRTRRTA